MAPSVGWCRRLLAGDPPGEVRAAWHMLLGFRRFSNYRIWAPCSTPDAPTGSTSPPSHPAELRRAGPGRPIPGGCEPSPNACPCLAGRRESDPDLGQPLITRWWHDAVARPSGPVRSVAAKDGRWVGRLTSSGDRNGRTERGKGHGVLPVGDGRRWIPPRAHAFSAPSTAMDITKKRTDSAQ